MVNMLRDKGMIIGIVATLLIVVGGVFFFSKPAGPAEPAKPVSNDILIPQNSFITSGILNGAYLPATDSAQVTLVEFGDYECPACGQFSPLVQKLMQEYGGKINFVFRNFPLSQHKNAILSAKAAESAGLQGKFWEMHEKIYATQVEWAKSANPQAVFDAHAVNLGLNMDQFKKDMESDTVKSKISRDQNDGILIKINQTPTYFVNGMKLDSLPFEYDQFKAMVTKDIK